VYRKQEKQVVSQNNKQTLGNHQISKGRWWWNSHQSTSPPYPQYDYLDTDSRFNAIAPSVMPKSLTESMRAKILRVLEMQLPDPTETDFERLHSGRNRNKKFPVPGNESSSFKSYIKNPVRGFKPSIITTAPFSPPIYSNL
jgi:hypothetical protein